LSSMSSHAEHAQGTCADLIAGTWRQEERCRRSTRTAGTRDWGKGKGASTRKLGRTRPSTDQSPLVIRPVAAATSAATMPPPWCVAAGGWGAGQGCGVCGGIHVTCTVCARHCAACALVRLVCGSVCAAGGAAFARRVRRVVRGNESSSGCRAGRHS
jgi:hypothetical protein